MKGMKGMRVQMTQPPMMGGGHDERNASPNDHLREPVGDAAVGRPLLRRQAFPNRLLHRRQAMG